MNDTTKKILGLEMLRNEKGIAILSVFLVAMVMAALSLATFSRAFAQTRAVEREFTKLQSVSAAEAGLQRALAQIAANAYTGYINTTSLSTSTLQSALGNSVGTTSASIAYPNQADWVTIQATGTVNGISKRVEGRVFLNSNLSKYLIYSDTTTLSLGSNLILGANDGTNPQGVPFNEDDRMATYHTNDLDFAGNNIHVYGDAHAERVIDGSTNSYVHGDTYAGNFTMTSGGTVTDDGVTGSLNVTDGFSDDIDRDHNGTVNSSDYPDRHDLTAVGADDAHQTEDLNDVDTSFYQAHKDSALPAAWSGSTVTSRYIELAPNADGTRTKVIVYSSGTYSTVSATYTLSAANAIIYNNGRVYIKQGSVVGRVSVVSSDDILFDGNVRYQSGASYCSSSNSAAFIAKDKVFFRPTSLEVSGIVYARKALTSGTLAIDADYDTAGNYNPSAKASGHFRLFGNVITNGTGNTSNYANDRAYVYDSNIKYYRPPGIPVRPELRTVREV